MRLIHIAKVTVAAAAVFGCLSAACSTSYQPRPSARVGFVIHNGAAMYVKDGHETPIGPLGGALEPLVAGAPPAAARAHRAHNQLAAGVPLYAGGLAIVVVGVTLSWSPLGWIVVGAGAASLASGLGLMGAGVTNVADAINLHNDSIDAPASP